MNLFSVSVLDPGECTPVHFPSGLLGFVEIKDYRILTPRQDVPFRWLQADHESSVAFVITDPFLFVPDYQVHITPQDMQEVAATDLDPLMVFVIVTLPSETSPRFTANLQGPVLVNRLHGRAKQLVFVHDRYQTRHPLTDLPAPSM